MSIFLKNGHKRKYCITSRLPCAVYYFLTANVNTTWHSNNEIINKAIKCYDGTKPLGAVEDQIIWWFLVSVGIDKISKEDWVSQLLKLFEEEKTNVVDEWIPIWNISPTHQLRNESTLFICVISRWNSLLVDTVTAESLDSFKAKLYTNLRNICLYLQFWRI